MYKYLNEPRFYFYRIQELWSRLLDILDYMPKSQVVIHDISVDTYRGG